MSIEFLEDAQIVNVPIDWKHEDVAGFCWSILIWCIPLNVERPGELHDIIKHYPCDKNFIIIKR